MRIASGLAVLLWMAALQAYGQTAGKRPVVHVLSTGGTIAGQGTLSTSLTQYKAGSVSGADLVRGVPEIARIADVRVEQIANVSSTDITVEHWLTLANRINRIFAEEPETAGVVITHGTNTMEETAYFLHLTVKHDRPVVMVGSMRPSTAISADGPLNLLNAVRVAAAPEARGKGVLVVLNDEINGARDVTKTNTQRVETFRSPDFGFLGYVDGDKISFYRAPLKRHTTQSEFDVAGLKELPAVEILYSYVQPSPVLIQALAASGVKGIVMAGTGMGLVSKGEKDALAKVKGPVIVRSNRTGSGRVAPRDEYEAMGMVAADTLNPQKARILLMLALTKTSKIDDFRRIFEQY